MIDDVSERTVSVDIRDGNAAYLEQPGTTLSPTGRAKRAGFDDVDVDSVVKALDDPRGQPGDLSEDRRHEQFPDDLLLPGFGEEEDSCGDPIPHACDSCGTPAVIGRTCNRKECPRCAPAWARLRTGNARSDQSSYGAQILAARAVHQAHRQERQYYQHLSVSFPETYHVDDADDPLDALLTMKERVKDAVTELGLHAGAVFFHGYRIDENNPESGDSRGSWKEILFNGYDWDSVREALEFAPHFHVVGVGSHVVGSDVTRIIEDETSTDDGPGVVIHRITERDDDSNVSIFGETELAKVLSYVISHTPYYDTPNGNTRIAAWRFGKSINQITPSEAMEEEMDYEARKVAPITLGLPFNSMVCTEDDVEQDDSDLPDPSLQGGDDHDHASNRSSAPAGGSSHGSSSDTQLPSRDFQLSDSSMNWSNGSGTWSVGEGQSWDVGGIRLNDGSEVPDPGDIPRHFLDVLEDANPEEIIAQFDGVDDRNVWEYKNEIRNAEGAEVCGGRMRRMDFIIEAYADQEWRQQASSIDSLTETIEEFVDEWADDQPHTPARLLLRELRDHFDDLPDELRIDRDQVTEGD